MKVESQFVTAEYDVSVLSAADSADLETWLKGQKLVLPDGAAADLDPYAKRGWRFVVAKVNVMKIFFVHQHGLLSPLRIVFDADDFELPLRPALMNSPGGQDLVINILARGQRYEPASYASILADSNIEVNDAAKAQFAPFHEAMIERALARSPRGIVTEFAGPVTVCGACLAPSISPAEMLSFGADAIPPPPNGDRTSGFVLTRLHTRYAPDGVVGDLVLRPAPPIAGGREVHAADGDFEKGAHASDANDFRTRYVVRHPWTGTIACTEPHRGSWGGYPGGAVPSPMVAHSIGHVGPTKMDRRCLSSRRRRILDLLPDDTPYAAARSDADRAEHARRADDVSIGVRIVRHRWSHRRRGVVVGRRRRCRYRRTTSTSEPSATSLGVLLAVATGIDRRGHRLVRRLRRFVHRGVRADPFGVPRVAEAPDGARRHGDRERDHGICPAAAAACDDGDGG